MAQKLTIITGPGRCGTSFAAEVFAEAGLDPGGSFIPAWRAGFEAPPVVEVNASLTKRVAFPECAESVALLPEFTTSMEKSVKGRRAVKDPRFCTTLDVWVHAGLVGRVLFMHRLPSESMASSDTVGMIGDKPPPLRERYQWWWIRTGYIAWVCDRHAIPRVVIPFPEVIREEGAAFHRLVEELRFHGVGREEAMTAIRKRKKLGLLKHSPGGSA